MKFFLANYGCASNTADSYFMKTLLYDKNWLESDLENADIVIVNSCAVKGPTENKIKDFIKKIKKPKHKIIIAGCLVSDKKFIEEFKEYSLINPYNVHKIIEAVNTILKEKKPVHFLSYEKYDKTNLYFKRDIAIIQPLVGCLGNCTYCKTKQAKPVFYSFPLENIIKRIDYYIKQGVKEIWISSEDNAAYGKDINKNLMDLLYAIEEKFQGKAMFRLGMLNPWLILDFLDEFVDFFKNTDAFFKFLHIPIQSASDSVLKAMNRPYTEKDLRKIFTKLKNTDITLATDVIVGFPNEKEEDFQKTLKFMQDFDFLVVNVSQFWPRPFTKAKEMKQLPTEIKKKRSRILSKYCREKTQKLLVRYVDKELNVYFDKKDENENTLGRTKNYISVIVKNKQLSLFEWKKVKIKKVENNHLIGEI